MASKEVGWAQKVCWQIDVSMFPLVDGSLFEKVHHWSQGGGGALESPVDLTQVVSSAGNGIFADITGVGNKHSVGHVPCKFYVRVGDGAV